MGVPHTHPFFTLETAFLLHFQKISSMVLFFFPFHLALNEKDKEKGTDTPFLHTGNLQVKLERKKVEIK